MGSHLTEPRTVNFLTLFDEVISDEKLVAGERDDASF
jgi:hypothetical protein